MSALAAPRMPRVVIAEALSELRAREHRLSAALDEVRSTIATLQSIGAQESRRPLAAVKGDTAPAGAIAGTLQPSEAERAKTVLRVIAECQPCARALLLERSGLSVSTLRHPLGFLIQEGKVRRVGVRGGTRYWSTEGLDAYVAEHKAMPDGSPA